MVVGSIGSLCETSLSSSSSLLINETNDSFSSRLMVWVVFSWVPPSVILVDVVLSTFDFESEATAFD